MSNFQLDNRLLNDCHTLGKLGQSHVLLMDNADYPWFILVPETHVTEIYQLKHQQQLELLDHINLLSTYIQQQFSTDKLNIGAIGNIVEQLHIHIVGRRQSDNCWPGVVWGTKCTHNYLAVTTEEITLSLESYCAGAFKRTQMK